jgi:hypothetical protein
MSIDRSQCRDVPVTIADAREFVKRPMGWPGGFVRYLDKAARPAMIATDGDDG